ncbi:MAG: AraC family transcriptional regulator [Dorea sp.]|jgi:AraC family transcriptional regulator|nr:AraC family transcriptional regulator [Dorea sp.]
MEWTTIIKEAVDYIETHITDNITINDVAGHVGISPFYFHKGFGMLCGYSLMEYIRNRRLSLAGNELIFGSSTVTELALKYGYDSPDSFTKAFTRFHGFTPSSVRKEKAMVKIFAPLKLTISLKGGYLMDYRITKKESFTIIGASKEFNYENAKQDIPVFWQEHFASGNGEHVCGMFGVNIDPKMGNETFEYLIADIYNPSADIPRGLVTRTIPAFTWAVFPCKGALPDSMQDVNVKIFSEWLPALNDYEFAAGYCIEMYDAPDKYPNGAQDENYYTEIWIPVKKKN